MVGISSKPVFLVTHPRSVSTAFERIFLSQDEDFACVHEPFSDAYHWGPEKLSERYENVESLRASKGLECFTFKAAFDLVQSARLTGKTVFIKDMAKCLMPLEPQEPSIAPSLQRKSYNMEVSGRNGCSPSLSVSNPTVVPLDYLARFRYAFLIRDPRRSVPSLYQCSIPPMSSVTGWNGFKESDIGYKELRRVFDYLKLTGLIGSGSSDDLCVVDADDLLSHPQVVVEQFCHLLGVKYSPQSLQWNSQDQKRATDLFKNWAPFHAVALSSDSLQPSLQENSDKADLADWRAKFGEDAARRIQKSVEDCMGDYLYLKQFAIKLR